MLGLPTYTASFLGPGGNIQSMDLPSGVDLSAYFSGGANFGQALPLSALGSAFQSFGNTPAGASFWGSPAGTSWNSNAWNLLGAGAGGGSLLTSQSPGLTPSNVSGTLGAVDTTSGLAGGPSLQGTAFSSLGSLFGSGGVGAVPTSGIGFSTSVPEILRDTAGQIGLSGAGSAGTGLLSSAGDLLPGVGLMTGSMSLAELGGAKTLLHQFPTDFQLFPGRVMETQSHIGNALQEMQQDLMGARTQGDVIQAAENFRRKVDMLAGVGGYGTQGNVPWSLTIPTLPGVGSQTHGVATTPHEWDANAIQGLLQQRYSALPAGGQVTVPNWEQAWRQQQAAQNVPVLNPDDFNDAGVSRFLGGGS